MVPDGSAGTAKCSANARAYADNASVIGIVGPTLSVCAAVQLPIANRGESGPLPMVSPSTTSVGLTRAGPGAAPDEPARYYPSGIRNYVRIIPADDFQAAANAVLARRLGLANVFVLSHRLAGGVADAFRSAAAKLGVDIAGAAEWSEDTSGAGYGELAREVRRSGADGVFLAGPIASDGDKLLGDLRTELGGRVRLLASDGFAVAALVKAAGQAAEGVTVSVSGVAPAITESGDSTANQVTIYRVSGGRLRLDRIITPSLSLVVRR
jgi:branched-chain amino acid transport system substrate-binding protein